MKSAVAMFVFAFAVSADAPLLLQRPTLSKTHMVFSYAGDLWSVPRQGGEAIRLTAGTGVETDPYFSPDGSQIAFTGEYEGNLDVYVVRASGGIPARLTWHPAEDNAVGWSPDGTRIIFRSSRHRDRERRLFTVSASGGPSDELPFPKAAHGSFSPDGTQLAYQPLGFSRPHNSFDAWRRYRGGLASPIWIARMSDSSIIKVPRVDSNDSHPMWIGNRVYFLSDRDGATTLYSYELASKKVERTLTPGAADIKWASAGPGAIVLERFGGISLYELDSRKERTVAIRVSGDLPGVRPRFIAVNRQLKTPQLSPSGARAIFEAHGEILTVPAEKGDSRNITNTTGVHERTPSWSPDGKWIAYWSDARGEYNLYLQNQTGSGEPRQIVMEERGFYFTPHWSPDSKKLAFTDNKLNLWVLDIEKNSQKKIATDTYYDPLGMQNIDPAWAPDSRWLSFTKKLKNHLRAVFIHSVETGQTHQVTDGLSDARSSQFDREGKYLYFAASTNTALTPHWLDMTSQLGRVTRNVYLVVLKKDVPSPFAPESDEEKTEKEVKEAADAKKTEAAASGETTPRAPAAEAAKPDEKKTPIRVEIDFDNIGQRIVAVPMPARDYERLVAGKAGVIYVAERLETQPPQPARSTIHKFDLKTRKADKLVDGQEFVLSANGEKMLFRDGDRYIIAAANAPPKPGEGVLKTDALEVRADPKAEWKQMYDEVWRIQRDWFYDPNYHGVNLEAQAKKYRPYLEFLAARGDLNYLFAEMLGDLTVGHLYIRGGQLPEVKGARVGLLGADYKVENNRYRFARIFNGENWNPDLRAPLTQPGVNVSEGDYLIAVNGRDVTPAQDVHSHFEGTAGKQTVLKVGADPSGSGAREVTVVPVETETGLRNLAWVESNRRKVDQMTNGRVAYVYLPNTAAAGFTYFNRYYFAQVGKEGAVIDERYNGGGQAADYIVDFLRRPLLNYWSTRYGEDFTTPRGAIFGPKAMIINESAGSGGDLLPWFFKRLKIGPLVGMRTWGGLVGILGFPQLMDGGAVTAPNLAFWTPEGEWEVENRGVSPDIEVDMDPKLVREDRDPQLEKAVELVMQALETTPPSKSKRPAFPNYNGTPPSGGQ
jgi:tricorn protease